jgi:hypothetical protein
MFFHSTTKSGYILSAGYTLGLEDHTKLEFVCYCKVKIILKNVLHNPT